MRKPITLAFAAVVYGTPAYANDVWQFKVTEDQNGPVGTCIEIDSIPCSITNQAAPYVLGTLTISASLAGYATTQDLPVTTVFDDKHLISFTASPSGLSVLNWPPPVANTPLLVNISVNEVSGKLSGFVYLDLDTHGSATIVMAGVGNIWVGYWRTWDGNTHQFRATSTKGHQP